jgi:hypothetical protein
MPLIPALLGIFIVVLIMWAINQFAENPQLKKALNVFFLVIIVILMIYILYDLIPPSWLTWSPHRRY